MPRFPLPSQKTPRLTTCSLIHCSFSTNLSWNCDGQGRSLAAVLLADVAYAAIEHDYKNKDAAHDLEVHWGPAKGGKPQMVISAEGGPQLSPDINGLPASPTSNSHAGDPAGNILAFLSMAEEKVPHESNTERGFEGCRPALKS